jgi:hypothetical protein
MAKEIYSGMGIGRVKWLQPLTRKGDHHRAERLCVVSFTFETLIDDISHRFFVQLGTSKVNAIHERFFLD